MWAGGSLLLWGLETFSQPELVGEYELGGFSRLFSGLWIEKETAEDSQLKSEVEAHNKDKAQTESALEQSAALRAKEAAAFSESDKMQKFSIGQLDQAIPLIEGKASAAAFLQSSPNHGSNLRRIISVTNYLSAET